ncbi:unnamed protein product [Polarella glacialis]|uniref:Isochorismatase-like domain-containing protein n=1 Tax=Polarella glacialis TaxID=89957 RepID=A0A813KZT3_POLGL|nr:unnamed protein product [Polarella glacialis]CAE8716726.1 unnamed protein product [Polarella glacialis]
MPAEYPIAKSKTALLVIDAQKVYSSTESPLCCKDFSAAIKNINALSAKMREMGSPVVVIKHIYKEDKSDVGRIGDFGIDGLWNETNVLSQYDDALIIDDSDIQISKTRYSAFVGTGLEETLKNKGVDTLIVTGFMTQFCVTSTTRHGADLDFKVITPSDANDGPDLPDVPIAVTKQALNAAWGIAVADTTDTENLLERMK